MRKQQNHRNAHLAAKQSVKLKRFFFTIPKYPNG